MARPRVFISSTFYDLRQIRTDLDSFIKRMGYESVRNESGKIPYGKDEKLEEYCYREIEFCDIVVAVIGGKFGTQSQQSLHSHSISQEEIRAAVEQDKSLFVFVEKGVLSEYQIYLNNKNTVGIKYNHTERPEIFKFIEEVYNLPRNNPIQPFETAEDITLFLQEQWAGLFHRFLQQQDRERETSLIMGLNQTASTLDKLVQYLSEQNETQSDALGQIVLSNHPAFRSLAQVMGIKFRVFFETRDELDKLLETFGYSEDAPNSDLDMSTWTRELKQQNKIAILSIRNELFTSDGRIQPQGSIHWDDDWITREVKDKPPEPVEFPDDDIPF
jgi:hypothetical protein